MCKHAYCSLMLQRYSMNVTQASSWPLTDGSGTGRSLAVEGGAVCLPSFVSHCLVTFVRTHVRQTSVLRYNKPLFPRSYFFCTDNPRSALLCGYQNSRMHTKLCSENLKGRPRCRWENNIRMDHGVWGWDDRTGCMAQNRDQRRALVNMVMNFRVP